MALEPLLSTRAQRAFMITILIQGFVVLAMVATTFGFVFETVDIHLPQYKTIPCYLALFILAEIFELLMAFDALRLRNVVQLIGILGFHLALVVFAAIQIHETRAALTGSGPGSLWRKVLPYLIVTPVIIAASWISLLFWVRELYFEFGWVLYLLIFECGLTHQDRWAIFHVVGANPAMKTMYQFYQIIICLLKFDFFSFVGVTIQLLIVVLQKNSAEFGLTIAAIPVVLTLLAGCGIAVKREIKWLMSVSLVLMLAAETYFIYKLVRFYEPDSREQYQTTRATLTVFSGSIPIALASTQKYLTP
ncbi:hypothetical protein EW026_g1278 [Hermanssonia centrifuga]|uniref:Uncharacterized protein n=1 Tax=Hermanssonia centrifuga TaxID=98765 RepID=A0A4S4KS15_9APHY|nr:hypothetical protein EW026_g1278 [Hermanssonia centrifuga]